MAAKPKAKALVPEAGVDPAFGRQTSEEDPVFRLIEAAKAADDAYFAVGRGKTIDEFDKATIRKLMRLEGPMLKAKEALREVVPQTTAGTLAYAEYWLGCRSFENLLTALKRELAMGSER